MLWINVAACLFTVLCMALTLYTARNTRRALRRAESDRADQTAARVAGAMAARLDTMREAAERADLIRITTEQAGIAMQAARTSAESAEQAKRWAYQVDKILNERAITSAGMAVTAGDPDEEPDTERSSGIVLAFPVRQ